MRKNFQTQLSRRLLGFAIALPALFSVAAYGQYAQKNVVQPGDPIVASSTASPSTEGVANAIDGTTAKYLNFDMNGNVKTAGFVVTPSVGQTWVTGIGMETANDGPERDPADMTLEGSNDTITNYADGNWTMIAEVFVPAVTNRYYSRSFSFTNYAAFKSYRWTVIKTALTNTCCMQVAEVQLLGTTVPKNVVQPGDQIFASSTSSPSTEGVANAIDGTTAKYLNFDMNGNVKTAGFAVTPSVGDTVINGISIETANDGPERDPEHVTVEGSNDAAITNYTDGAWSLLADIDNIPAITNRYFSRTFLFPNVTPYKHYRWTVIKTALTNTCCMQVAEVQFLGSSSPKNVVVPGDQIIASSTSSPSTEGVANAIDGTTAKYLNFDMNGNVKTAGFVVTPSVGATVIIGLGIETANDGPERDPEHVTVEGSNDDTVTNFTDGAWSLIADIDNIPAITNRYFFRDFYFPNQTSYKHYRWTVIKTALTNTCCMQVAEVQFLAITSQADCSKAAFVSTPVNTPALAGTPAEFFVTVNGPWPLQWYVNGVAAAGATKTSFSTDPLSAAVATNLYNVAIVGCQTSPPVHAVLFTPATIKSVGMQFGGGGANGTPEFMDTNDIAGVQLQAFWNVVTNDTAGTFHSTGITGDALTMGDTLLDSDGNTNAITFEYTTSGRWGAGVSTDSATGRLLNGVAGQGGAGGTDQIMTFHNVPAGTHALLVYAISPPLQIQTVKYTVTNPVPITYYARVLNSVEYNPAPGYYRVTSTNPANPSIGDFIRFDGVKPDANGDVMLVFNVTGVGADQATGVNALQLVLNAPNPGSPPVVTQSPQPGVAPAGGSLTLTVSATGTGLTYQWRKDGKNLSNGGDVKGAQTATLTISPFSAGDAGIYSVAIFSPAGSIVSGNVDVALSNYNIQDRLVDYWKFNETSGTNAANSATNGLPATVYGTSTWTNGQVGGAFAFDGSSSYMFVSNYAKPTAAMAASAWVNIPSSGAFTILQNADGPITVTDGQFSFGISQDGAGNAVLGATVVIGAKIITLTSVTNITVASWHHVAFTADGAQLRLFLDGQQAGSADYLGSITPSSIPSWLSIGASLATDNTVTPPVIGPSATGPNYFSGSLDELALWHRALSASEVAALYAAGNSGKDLTTVVESPPVTGGGTLHASIAAGKITVTWSSGSLQSATSITGPWSSVTNATGNSFTEAVAAGAKFYRTH